MNPLSLATLLAALPLAANSAPASKAAELTATAVELPGGAPVSMDYLVYDAATNSVWIPAGNTGKVDVLDAATGKLEAIGGFETEKRTIQREGKSMEVTMGPSSGFSGDGVVYIGNRAGSRVCAVSAKTHERQGCATLPSTPDGVVYVATTKEVWVTTPRTDSLTILDASTPGAPKLIEGDKGHLAVDGPEGYAVDAEKGIFYTNLEEKDHTLGFDVKTRKQVSDWPSGCGKEGPRGLSIDPARKLIFVACGAGGAVALSTVDGKELGRIKTGAGVDNIDYLAKDGLLFIASGADGMFTLAHAGDKGELTKVASAKTAPGGRVVVADHDGNAYIADSKGGKVWVVKRKR